MELSFIIPAYNASKYIGKCLDSIYGQGLIPGSFEVIVVNDGSSDNTLEVLHDLESTGKYPGLKVLTQNNKGAAAARNYGIREAAGDRIWCVDSDDWLEPGSVEEIISEVRKYDVDLFFVQIKRSEADAAGDTTECRQTLPTGIVMSGEEAILNGYQPFSACAAIIRKSLLDRHHLSFREGSYHEDVQLMYQAVALAKDVLFTNHAPYVYRIHSESILHSSDLEKTIKRLSDNVNVIKTFNKFSETLSNTSLSCRIKEQAFSVAVGTISSLWFDKSLRKAEIINPVLNRFKEEGLFPITGRARSVKVRSFSIFLNCLFSDFIFRIIRKGK